MAEWTPARIAKLRQLWPAHSATEVAEKLGGFEHTMDGGRNAVIGKAHKLGLKAKCVSSAAVAALVRSPENRARFRAMWLSTDKTVAEIAVASNFSLQMAYKLAREMRLPKRMKMGRGGVFADAKT